MGSGTPSPKLVFIFSKSSAQLPGMFARKVLFTDHGAHDLPLGFSVGSSKQAYTEILSGRKEQSIYTCSNVNGPPGPYVGWEKRALSKGDMLFDSTYAAF